MLTILTSSLIFAATFAADLDYQRAEQVTFLEKPEVTCDGLDFLVFVHSRVDHFYERNVIRKTWKSVENVNGKTVKAIFVVGNPKKALKRIFSNYSQEISEKLKNEISMHKDILHLDILDKYDLLSLKHIASYRWINESCANARYYIKADDDAFIDIHHFVRYFSENFDYENAFYCHVQSDVPPQRSGKWAVALEAYSNDKYPEFCSGLAYVVTLPVIQRVLQEARSHKWLWVDDVFVTGVLGQSTKRFHLNLRYSFNFEDLHELADDLPLKNYQFLFTHIDTTDEFWGRTVLRAWKKLEKIRTRAT